MKYDMTRPCDNCPFLTKGGVRLFERRALGIAVAVLNGMDFSCHKTIDYDDEGEVPPGRGPNEQMCAGAMIFAEKQGLKFTATPPLDRKVFGRVFGSVRAMLGRQFRDR